jgi:hypothetical protein
LTDVKGLTAGLPDLANFPKSFPPRLISRHAWRLGRTRVPAVPDRGPMPERTAMCCVLVPACSALAAAAARGRWDAGALRIMWVACAVRLPVCCAPACRVPAAIARCASLLAVLPARGPFSSSLFSVSSTCAEEFGLGFGVWGLGFGGWGLGFRVQCSGFRVRGSGFRVQCSVFRVQVSVFRVQDLGCFEVRVPGFKFRVSGW